MTASPTRTSPATTRPRRKQNTEAARLWFNGLRAINEKLGVKAVYDLSATPFFLSGSGYREGTLFPWVVSDFGLVEAIESGIVKIPRVPVDDNATTPNVRVPQPLAGHQGRPAEEGPQGGRGHPRPDARPARRRAQRALRLLRQARSPPGRTPTRRSTASPPPSSSSSATTPPSPRWSTTTSPAGRSPSATTSPSGCPASSRCSPTSSTASRSPGRARSSSTPSSSSPARGCPPEFKKIAATEIEEFNAEYARRVPGRKAEDMDDGQIMREVMNTVGKAGKLGEPVRCVVSRLDAHRGLGRQHRHPHPRRPRVRHPAPVRAGRRPRPAPPLLRARRERPLHPRVRRRVRRPVPVHAHRRQGQEPDDQADPLRPRPAGENRIGDQLSAGGGLPARDPRSGAVRGIYRTVPADSGHEGHSHRDRGGRAHRRDRARTRSTSCGPSGTRRSPTPSRTGS